MLVGSETYIHIGEFCCDRSKRGLGRESVECRDMPLGAEEGSGPSRCKPQVALQSDLVDIRLAFGGAADPIRWQLNSMRSPASLTRPIAAPPRPGTLYGAHVGSPRSMG